MRPRFGPALLCLCIACVLACIVVRADSDDVIDDAPSNTVDFEEEPEQAAPAPSVDRAVLIAHKHIVEDYIVHGRNMTVALKLYNVGSAAAEDVHIKDTYPANATFQLVEGELEQTVGSIGAGRTAEVRYVVIPRGGQRALQSPGAEVSYASAPGLSRSELLSTMQPVNVLSKAQHIEQYFVNAGKVLSLGMLRTSRDWFNAALALTATAAALGSFFLMSSLSTTRASSRRSAAARDLGLADS